MGPAHPSTVAGAAFNPSVSITSTAHLHGGWSVRAATGIPRFCSVSFDCARALCRNAGASSTNRNREDALMASGGSSRFAGECVVDLGRHSGLSAVGGGVCGAAAGAGILPCVGLRPAGIPCARGGRATCLGRGALLRRDDHRLGVAGEVRLADRGLLAGGNLRAWMCRDHGVRGVVAPARPQLHKQRVADWSGNCRGVAPVCDLRAGGHRRGQPALLQRHSLRPRPAHGVCGRCAAHGSSTGQPALLAGARRADALLLLLVCADGGRRAAGFGDGAPGHDRQRRLVGLRIGRDVAALLQEFPRQRFAAGFGRAATCDSIALIA